MERKSQKTYKDFPVFSTGTGKVHTAILTDEQIYGRDPVLCPKTQLRAFPCNMAGCMQLTYWLAAEMHQLKRDMFDVEAYIEAQDAKERGESINE